MRQPARTRWMMAMVVALGWSTSAAFAAGAAHEHGALKLDVAIEGKLLTILLEAPLDNLLGFERAPRSDAERRRTDQAVARLRDTAALMRPDAAAGCVAQPADLHAPVLGLGDAPATPDGHAELVARWSFVCQAAPAHLELRLFDAFRQLRRVDAQVITGKGQHKATLTPTAPRVKLAR